MRVKDAADWRESIKLRSQWVRWITKEMFPVGRPVTIEAIIDTQSGWEFDAPMHVMRPFHRAYAVGSICDEVIQGKVEDILIDLDIGRQLPPDDSAWPYTGDYLKRVFRSVQKGLRLNRFWYIRATVKVKSWAKHEDDYVKYDLKIKSR